VNNNSDIKQPSSEENSPLPFSQTSSPQKGDTIASIRTNMGTIKVRLFPKYAPQTVENFVGLSQKKYYDGVIFHRVIEDFMIQGGDPEGTGMGGESIWGNPFKDEFSPELKNIRGALSMANSGPNTNGSQFFIVQRQEGTSWLDGKHSVFGQVYKGMDVVDSIAGVDTLPGDRPKQEIVIETITISTF
jgi:peptidyl-prolyl cis-trans isomerase B (cyclophilin B)